MRGILATFGGRAHLFGMLFEGNERRERERQMKAEGRLPPINL
jgi:hypothetical protein